MIPIITASQKVRKFLVYDEDSKTYIPDSVQLYSLNEKLDSKESKNYHDYIFIGKSQSTKLKLAEELSFKQYPDKNSDNRLIDLQDLIKRNDRNGVYLWDPYLRPKDIFNTLFYSPSINVPLRAITSIKSTKKKDCMKNEDSIKFKEKIEKIKEEFKKNENCDYLNLEVRMQHHSYGNNFHDRFLIFPSFSIFDEAKVYSLGTSINSFNKKSHHILQKVSYPEIIIEEFNKMWEQLDNEECILWKSGQ